MMNLAEYSIRNSVVTWVVVIVLLGGGFTSFQRLSRLEDPEFTIKEALILTPYPGASASEVEEEVSDVMEKAAQQLGQVKRVESRSSRGLSIVQVVIKEEYDKRDLPQIWDELRRKVSDHQRDLPPGAGPSVVNDDFGDVYGVYLALTGEGHTYRDLYETAKFLQRELLHVTDVKRVDILGHQQEVVYVEMQREKMAKLRISPQDIYTALASKNLVGDAGRAVVENERIPLNPTGGITSEAQFRDLLIRGRGPDDASLVYLGDVADIVRGYEDPPRQVVHYDGKPAVFLGISTVQGGNVVRMGEGIDRRMAELLPEIPLGIQFGIISHQSKTVVAAINNFMISLVEAVFIVIAVLLVFMGLRSGLIIGAVLFITIMGSFIIMEMKGLILERVSLGGLIIALGMLVDNAIVVTDGMRVRIQMGKNALDAAKDVVGQTAMPLLGATAIAILAFAPIGLSKDNTGEYCRSLFYVVLISLALSWFTAVTTTPLLCKVFLKKAMPESGKAEKDPYGGILYRVYRGFLIICIRFRWVTVAVVVGMLLASLASFTTVKQSFFPDSTRAQFMVDFWFPEGMRLEETNQRLEQAQKYLRQMEGVIGVAASVGGPHTRFLVVYTPEKPWDTYAQCLVDVDDYHNIPALISEAQEELSTLFPDSTISGQMFKLGPGGPGKVRVRITGPDPEVLRELAGRAEAILAASPRAKGVRTDWRTKTKELRPQMAESQARTLGIDRLDVARAFEAAVEGTVTGVYREEDELLPIIARSPEDERLSLGDLGSVQVWSPAAQQMISMDQVVTGFATEFENPYIWRRQRSKTITVFADPKSGLASELFQDVKVKVEKALNVDLAQALGTVPSTHTFKTIPVKEDYLLPLKDMPGYYMAWGGEAEDSATAQANLAAGFPPVLSMMIFISILLFGSIRKTLAIWLTVPTSIIGVTVGLVACNQPFGFMSLLGLLSLSGMLIKCAIVLIDEIGAQLSSGKHPFHAVVDSSVSRFMPVLMASATTMLGMIPLFSDAFFAGMAVSIVFGLGFGTVLILVVVPVLYSILFRIPYLPANPRTPAETSTTAQPV
ncbi:MAG: multidrug transporter AcrB [Candidatus Hydrogenedentota bacterium]